MVYAFMVLQVALLASLASDTAGVALLAPLIFPPNSTLADDQLAAGRGHSSGNFLHPQLLT